MEAQKLRTTRVFDYTFSVKEFLSYEMGAAQILLQLPNLIFQRQTTPSLSTFSLASWGAKRRRSALNVEIPSLSLSLGQSDYKLKPCKKPILKKPKEEASSPETPLSFSPSESDCWSKRSKRNPFKKKMQKWKEVHTELSVQNLALKNSMRNVLDYKRGLEAKNKALNDLKRHLELKLRNARRGFYTKEEEQAPIPKEEEAEQVSIRVGTTQIPKEEEEMPKRVMQAPFIRNQTRTSEPKIFDPFRQMHPCFSSGVGVRYLNLVPDLSFFSEEDFTNNAAAAAVARKRRYEINKEKRSVKPRF